MKKVRNMLAAAMMMAVLTVGTSFAGDGILVAGFGDEDPCKETTQSFGGILVAGFAGILVAGFDGILVAGLTEDTCTITIAE